MIDVEKRALCAFEKNFLPVLQCPVQKNDGVGDKRPQFFSRGQVTFVHVAIIDRLRSERLENAVVLPNFSLQFFREQNRLHQI